MTEELQELDTSERDDEDSFKKPVPMSPKKSSKTAATAISAEAKGELR